MNESKLSMENKKSKLEKYSINEQSTLADMKNTSEQCKNRLEKVTALFDEFVALVKDVKTDQEKVGIVEPKIVTKRRNRIFWPDLESK